MMVSEGTFYNMFLFIFHRAIYPSMHAFIYLLF